MNRQTVVWPHGGISFGHKRHEALTLDHGGDCGRQDADGKKPVTEGHVPHGSIHINRPAQASPWMPGRGGEQWGLMGAGLSPPGVMKPAWEPDRGETAQHREWD